MTRSRKVRIQVPNRRPGHRSLVYCTDATVPWWGYWCRDCNTNVVPWTQSKNAAEKQASRHSVDTATLVGS